MPIVVDLAHVAEGGDGLGSYPSMQGGISAGRANLTVAVVGLGYWGPNLLRVLMESSDVEVRWICDLDAARLERQTQRYPAVAATQRLEDVLSDSDVDCVLLATPVFSHYELARECLEAGKHVFVEKPLAPSSEQAAALVDLATGLGLTLSCGHTFLHSPAVRKVKELISSGELGDLYFVSASRVNLGLHQRDTSVVWDLAPHDFSILLYWLGQLPVSIRATGRDSIVPGIADVAFVSMEFPDGLIANVELSWLAPSKLRRTVVVGSRKMVVYEDGAAEPIKIYDRGVDYKDPETFGEWHLSYRTGDIMTPKLSNDEPLAVQLAEFIRAVKARDGARPALRLAYQVVLMTEAAATSLAGGGEQVMLDEHALVTELR
jgi:predicted dehydrogenase